MTATTMDRKTFLAKVRQSGLIPPDVLMPALNDLPETDRGRVIARTLVERGVLTRFQAELLLAGRTEGFLLGQYRILDQLGKGGMGRVFKAEHQTMNRVVALKVLASHLTSTPKAQQLFQREVRAAARLIHPNIVTAYDANNIEGRFYLVMEFVDGPNLSQLVKERGALPVPQACDFIRQAALGLQHAHEQGLVHRDIKPGNLLVQRAGGSSNGYVVKILDFGLARLASGDQPGMDDSVPNGANTVMGTPDYVSPEQARDARSADIRSDIYSLGCTLYYLLAGQPPFAGGTALEKLVRHAADDPIPVEQLRPEVPASLWVVLRRMMAKNPEQRYATPAEVASALAPFAGGSDSGWLIFDPSKGPRAVPPSGSDLPQTTPTAASPWTDLTEDEADVGTLGLDAGTTAVSPLLSDRFRAPAEPPAAHWGFWAVLLGVLALIGLGLALSF